MFEPFKEKIKKNCSIKFDSMEQLMLFYYLHLFCAYLSIGGDSDGVRAHLYTPNIYFIVSVGA